MLSVFAQDLWAWVSKLVNNAVTAIGQLLQGVVNGIGNFLQQLLQPVFAIINAFFYFVQQLFTLVGLLFELLAGVFHVLFAFAGGLLATLTGISYNNSAPTLPGDVSGVFAHFQTVFGLLQLDNIAYVLHFAIWVFTAYIVVKMLGNFGMGGGGS